MLLVLPPVSAVMRSVHVAFCGIPVCLFVLVFISCQLLVVINFNVVVVSIVCR
jgi:hypothetical protein